MADDLHLTERFEMRATRRWLAALDDWRRNQPGLPSRGEAIRRLVDTALSPDLARPHDPKSRARAKALAESEVDKALASSGHHDDVKHKRKKALTKFPAELRPDKVAKA